MAQHDGMKPCLRIANKLFAMRLRLTFGTWSKHDEHIGSAELPPGVDPAEFIGAEKETR